MPPSSEFAGYNQHDSSELMNFLLDGSPLPPSQILRPRLMCTASSGLHEDLNRVIDKPYVPAVEHDPSKTDEVSQFHTSPPSHIIFSLDLAGNGSAVSGEP